MENLDRSCQTHDALLLERRKHLLLGVFRAREAALLETTASFHFTRRCEARGNVISSLLHQERVATRGRSGGRRSSHWVEEVIF